MEEKKVGIVESIVKDVWPITANRFVAYIDIMGFKDMVARMSHLEIYEIMKKIEFTKSLYAKIDWQKDKINLVKTTNYSDSIMIYSKDESYDAAYSFLATVSAIETDLLQEGIPHKGAVAFGQMTLDWGKSIFFGQSLIDAYQLQEELYFYGIIIHASAEGIIESQKLMDFVHNYLCPLKNGYSKHLTVEPLLPSSKDPQYQKNVDDLFDSIKKLRYKTSGHLRQYIDNTEKYLKSVHDNDLKRKKVIESLYSDEA
jgi:hypothetical protein